MVVTVKLIQGKGEGINKTSAGSEVPTADRIGNQVLLTKQKSFNASVHMPSEKPPISGVNEQGGIANIGEENNRALPPGVVLVILTVTPGGQVQQITWTHLPPISEAKLQELETLLRSDIYLASGKEYVVRKLVDVWAVAGPKN